MRYIRLKADLGVTDTAIQNYVDEVYIPPNSYIAVAGYSLQFAEPNNVNISTSDGNNVISIIKNPGATAKNITVPDITSGSREDVAKQLEVTLRLQASTGTNAAGAILNGTDWEVRLTDDQKLDIAQTIYSTVNADFTDEDKWAQFDPVDFSVTTAGDAVWLNSAAGILRSITDFPNSSWVLFTQLINPPLRLGVAQDADPYFVVSCPSGGNYFYNHRLDASVATATAVTPNDTIEIRRYDASIYVAVNDVDIANVAVTADDLDDYPEPVAFFDAQLGGNPEISKTFYTAAEPTTNPRFSLTFPNLPTARAYGFTAANNAYESDVNPETDAAELQSQVSIGAFADDPGLEIVGQGFPGTLPTHTGYTTQKTERTNILYVANEPDDTDAGVYKRDVRQLIPLPLHNESMVTLSNIKLRFLLGDGAPATELRLNNNASVTLLILDEAEALAMM